MKRSTWEGIQKLELQYHLHKDKNFILDFQIKYWNSLLERIYPHVSITETTRILEVGCGCCGMIMAIDRGILVGVDPLMDQYLEHFDYLHNANAKWITGVAEEITFSKPFDIIIVINSLDHMYDPSQAARNLSESLIPGGHLILSVNCHNTEFFCKYYRRFYRSIDRYHPHHFRPQDVLGLFPHYQVIKVEHIDHLFHHQRKQYREQVLQRKGFDWGRVFGYLFNPLKHPVAMARILRGSQSHRKKPNHNKMIFSTYLFILQKPYGV